ncbi:MAG: cytochrome c [Hyphomonas sp.]
MRNLVSSAAAAALLLVACGQPETAPAPVEPEAVSAPARPAIDTVALGIPTDADSISDGRDIALNNCASCHGIDNADALRSDAPALRYVLSLYPPESLAEDFRYGIHVGHEDMPDFVFGDLGMDVLLSYLVSIQEVPEGE